jgi:hypothetical protein
VEETRWYPSMRILWQDRPASWDAVIEEAARRIAAL